MVLISIFILVFSILVYLVLAIQTNFKYLVAGDKFTIVAIVRGLLVLLAIFVSVFWGLE